MKSFKKVLAIILALAMTITIAPGMTKVKAGDSFNIKDIVWGLNKDKNIGATKKVYVKMSDLKERVDEGIEDRVKAGKAWFEYSIFSVAKDPNTRVYEGNATYKNGIFYFTVDAKYIGKYVRLSVHDPEGTNYGDEENWYKVEARNILILSGPQITGVSASSDFLNKTVTVNFTGYGLYRYDDEEETHTVKEIIVKLFRDNKLIGTIKSTNKKTIFKNLFIF